MSSVSESGGRSSGKTIIAAVLGVIALLLIIVSIIYFIEPAHSLPAFMGHIAGTTKRATSPRYLRGAATLVVGIICAIGAWFTLKGGKAKADASASEPTAAASK